jgi:hypothetical protein
MCSFMDGIETFMMDGIETFMEKILLYKIKSITTIHEKMLIMSEKCSQARQRRDMGAL